MDLCPHFEQLNQQFFDGFLEPPVLRWNSRLRASAGRFIPGSRKWHVEQPPVIEIASYLLEREEDAGFWILDTLGHEMIHYWLWVRHRPYGHTEEFWQKMKAIGVSRYNQVPKRRPFLHMYRCPGCNQEFPTRRKLSKKFACAKCCKKHNRGFFDSKFRLEWVSGLSKQEKL